MRGNQPRWTDVTGMIGIVLIGTGLLLMGCETGNGGNRSAREINLAEFSRPADHGQVNGVSVDRAETEAVAPELAPAESEPADAGGPGQDQLPQLGAGPVSPEDVVFGPEPGTRVIVDSLIGQINGRPIYADTFFAPIEDQLRAIARRSGQRQFFDQANEVITQHLGQIVRNELFLADARAQLTPQQQQGLFAWMRAMREQEIMQGGGTQTAAARRLEEQHGMTMEEYLAARRDMALLRKLQEERISPRVIVAWRDIEREYRRRFHEFNPPARMRVSRIRLSTDRDAGLIETATEKLAAGADFTEVAGIVGMSDGGEWQEFQIGEQGVDGLQLSGSIKDHLRGLQVNQTSEPFEVGTSTWWLHVAEIHQPEGRSLYDPEVQRMLHEHIWQQRFNEELNRYMESLFAEGVHDELDRMRERLLIIAYDRYGPR